MSLNGEDIVIIDIEYRDGEYIFCQDQTRCVLPCDKSILYLGTFQDIEKGEVRGHTQILIKKLTGTQVCVAIYK